MPAYPLKIIIDGPPGSGKTTFLTGKSHADCKHSPHWPCLADDHVVAQEYIACVLRELHTEHKCLVSHAPEFIARIQKRAVDRYVQALSEASARCASHIFFDRGPPTLVLVAQKHGIPLDPSELPRLSYDNPVFLFEPIASFDLSVPIPGRTFQFTLEERQHRLEAIEHCYASAGFTVARVPVFSHDVLQNYAQRKDFVMRHIKEKTDTEVSVSNHR